MKHYKAIRCLESRINSLRQEILKAQKTIEEPEMLSDLYYAQIDIANWNEEITSLQETITELAKIPIINV
jgi:hypothetical protein